MSRLLYAVTATLPDEATAERYLAWLEQGHVEAVVTKGRAAVGWIARHEGPEIRVETLYVFRTREDFETYEREHAPVLREDGRRHFGEDSGVRFSRRVARLVGRYDGPAGS